MLGALSAETITYLSWRRDRCFEKFGSLKINVERVLIDPPSLLILICISDLTLFTHSERSNSNFMKRTLHYSGTISWIVSPSNLKTVKNVDIFKKKYFEYLLLQEEHY